MTIDLTQLVLLGLLTASLHWLIARSEIARPFWSWRGHPAWFTKLLACAGCSGWWLGGLLGAWGVTPVPVVDGPYPHIVQAFFAAVLGVVVTPVFEAVLLWGLRESAIAEPEEPEHEDTGSIPNAPTSAFDSAIVTPVDNPTRRPR